MNVVLSLKWDRQGTGRGQAGGEDVVWKFKSDEAMIFCMCM